MSLEAVDVRLGAAPYQAILNSGPHEWLQDVSVAQGGGNAAPGPHEHLLASLGACTAMTIKMYAYRKGWPVEDVRISMRYAADHRDGDSKIERTIELIGTLDDAQRARLMQIADACPIHKILSGPIAIATQAAPPTA
ncbi:putative redox protein [Andreprevotia lacus DSM 23236]|jgi:putative redox protein|uniref:Putative redox protein n=1 Tax=Andreprevotia lacus DSM 23236 TaxID=1121001 RepID=A0A1W1WWP1_9NEIS|nr:OsmC family protein [Andreprevotia lacus]SMC16017.1 putative redox protein [Andreprevotia lacus DSM 23236]